jgi:hypothetical protein
MRVYVKDKSRTVYTYMALGDDTCAKDILLLEATMIRSRDFARVDAFRIDSVYLQHTFCRLSYRSTSQMLTLGIVYRADKHAVYD